MQFSALPDYIEKCPSVCATDQISSTIMLLKTI